MVRLVFSDPETGRELLERAGLAMIESDLIAIELKRTQQPLVDVFGALLRAEVNLVQSYPLMIPNFDGTCVAIMVDNIDTAQETLVTQGFRLLSEDELSDLG